VLKKFVQRFVDFRKDRLEVTVDHFPLGVVLSRAELWKGLILMNHINLVTKLFRATHYLGATCKYSRGINVSGTILATSIEHSWSIALWWCELRSSYKVGVNEVSVCDVNYPMSHKKGPSWGHCPTTEVAFYSRTEEGNCYRLFNARNPTRVTNKILHSSWTKLVRAKLPE